MDSSEIAIEKTMSAWERVKRARSDRPNAYDFIRGLAPDFIELHGDRTFGDDRAMVGGIGSLGSIPVTFIGTLKGHDLESNQTSNFGMVHPEGYRKAKRLMDQANKFGRPIITFIDTPGAYPGIESEDRGQAQAIAECLLAMSDYSVPIISIIVGEGGSGGALAIGMGNEVWMYQNAIYCVLSPEGFASILYKDSGKAQEASEVMKITSEALRELGVIDRILSEDGFEEKNFEALKQKLIETLESYRVMPPDSIREHRQKRFREIGDVNHEQSYR